MCLMGSLGVGMPEPFINQNVMGFFDFKGKGSIICIKHTSNIPRKQSWWNVDSDLRFPGAFVGIRASEKTVSISAQLQKLPLGKVVLSMSSTLQQQCYFSWKYNSPQLRQVCSKSFVSSSPSTSVQRRIVGVIRKVRRSRRSRKS